MRLPFFVILAFLFFYSFVGIVFANPIPWDPMDSFLHLEPLQYFSIVVAEFCALVVGTAVLSYNHQTLRKKAALTMLIALTVSYLLGLAVWIIAFQSGIFLFNISNLVSLTVLLLPEIIGILIGTAIIKKLYETTWKISLITMATAMVTSLAIGILLAAIRITLIPV